MVVAVHVRVVPVVVVADAVSVDGVGARRFVVNVTGVPWVVPRLLNVSTRYVYDDAEFKPVAENDTVLAGRSPLRAMRGWPVGAPTTRIPVTGEPAWVHVRVAAVEEFTAALTPVTGGATSSTVTVPAAEAPETFVAGELSTARSVKVCVPADRSGDVHVVAGAATLVSSVPLS